MVFNNGEDALMNGTFVKSVNKINHDMHVYCENDEAQIGKNENCFFNRTCTIRNIVLRIIHLHIYYLCFRHFNFHASRNY